MSMCVVIAGCGGGGDGGSMQPPQGVNPVVSGPATTVPPPAYSDLRRTEAFQRTNEIRNLLGIGLVAQNAKVDAAAQAHANYLGRNGGSHYEDASKPGFTGVDPGDRLLAADYSFSSAMEVLTYAPGSGADQVDLLMNTLYHRLPFVAYDFVHVGVGSAASVNNQSVTPSVLVFARPLGSLGQEAPAVPYVVWPMRGASIARGSIENESPTPPGAGYPITINFDPRKEVIVSKFELREGGTALLPATLLTSSNDPNALIPKTMNALSPKEVLKPATGFTVLWEGTVDGKPLSVSWGFSTK